MIPRIVLISAAFFSLAALAALGIWSLFGGGGGAFMPHATCYLWNRPLIILHVGSDLLIGLSYVAISATLAYLVSRTRRQIPFHWMFLAFGVFIIACGMTHLMEVWTVWSPRYWFSGNVKLVTAVASVATAFVLPPLIPQVLHLLEEARLSRVRKEQLEAANTELQALYQRVKELDTLKTNFFASVSHELRTPLALILGPVDHLLASDALSAAHRHHLDVMRRNAMVLHKHVNDLLDVSKLEAGKMHLDLKETDLADLLRLGVGYFDSMSTDRGVRMTIAAPETFPVRIDPEKIQRVITNLLTNALKFTPRGGQMRISLARERADAVLRIEDSGPGVAEEFRAAIFERYRQGGTAGDRALGGTGLGLAIVKEFVELHGGWVSVGDSEFGGAEFKVRLPIVEPELPASDRSAPEPLSRMEIDSITALLEPDEAPSGEKPGKLEAPRPDSERPLVLIVEDNAEMNRFMQEILRDEFRTVAVQDGAAAIRAAGEELPDLILSDMMMPGMAGDELIRRIRAHETLRSVPVILVTAKADDELQTNLLGSGANDYVRKPFSVDELRARVRNHVAAKRVRDTLQHELESQTEDIGKLATEIAVRSRQLAVAKETAEAANRTKDQFLAMLSHELRTPLTPVLAAVSTLEAIIDLSPEMRETVRMIRRNVELEARLIDDLLDLTRASRGKMQLELETLDLHSLLRSAVEIMESEIRARELHLELDLEAAAHHVRGEWPRLLQIFWNLIQNAVKFTPPGGMIRIRTWNEGDRVRAAIFDTGIGIRSEALPRVFEAFEQGAPEITRQYGGLGLGLALAKALVELHGGVIEAASEGEGRGAVLTVALDTVEPGEMRTPATIAEPEPQQEASRVLLVEDHADTREAIEKLLRRWGYQVDVAGSVAEAEQKLSSNVYDILLTDVGLPDGDGTVLLPAARKRSPELGGIAVSGYGMEKDIARSKAAGFAEHLTKPVAPHRLRAALQAVVEARRRG